MQIHQSHYPHGFLIFHEASGVSEETRKYLCRQHETLDCRKLHKQLSNSYHRSGKGHVRQLNGILLQTF
jgi:hypothetical protein